MFSRTAPPLERIYNGSRVNFLILNRFEVAMVTPQVPYVVISITDPERGEAVIAKSDERQAVLRLQFHDRGMRREPSPGKVAMTREDALTVLRFVQTHLPSVELIVCQCEAGISRSAAIAAALSRILQGEDRFFFSHYVPNDWIYRTLIESAREIGGIK